MHVRTVCLISWAAATAPLAACNTPRSAAPSMSPAGSLGVALESRSVEALCTNRPDCSVDRVQIVDALPGSKFVTALIAPQSTAQDDDGCARREYWLIAGDRSTLLAADCAAQLGADSQGPAEVTLTGNFISVRYVEFQEEDRCELLDATINLVAVTVEHQERRVGTVTRNKCVPEGAHSVIPPAGDGSQAKPLLVLHRG